METNLNTPQREHSWRELFNGPALVGAPGQSVATETIRSAAVARRVSPAPPTTQSGIQFEVVKHTKAKRGFVLLLRRWVVERSFAWAARFRRRARDDERLALAGYQWLGFALLMLKSAFPKSA